MDKRSGAKLFLKYCNAISQVKTLRFNEPGTEEEREGAEKEWRGEAYRN